MCYIMFRIDKYTDHSDQVLFILECLRDVQIGLVVAAGEGRSALESNDPWSSEMQQEGHHSLVLGRLCVKKKNTS
jgi:hypothetical protein